MVEKVAEKKQKIYHIIIGVVAILFIVISILQNKNAEDYNFKLNYSGIIQNIVYFDGRKGPDININGKWYYIGYHPDLVDNKYIGCKIEKRINEQGIWIESKKGTGRFIYYDVYSGIIEDRQYINRLNRVEMKKK